MDTNVLSMFAGSVISLLFSYVPGFNVWFDKQTGEMKRLIAFAALAVTSVAIVALSCYGVYDLGVVCSESGLLDFFKVFILSLVSNQSTYLISPTTNEVKRARVGL